MRLTEDALSSLEDSHGALSGPDAAPQAAEPRSPVAPASEDKADSQATTAKKEPTVERRVGDRAVAEGEIEPPVFYRPPDSGGKSVSGGGSGPVCGDLGRVPESSRVVFPLEREYFYSYEDTWGAARPQGGHEGTDLMTPASVPEYAVTDGTVVPVAGSNPNGWNTLGGYAVMVRADYSIGPVKKGDLFYYAHLERESPLPIGARVRAGQVVGYAGDTGQGPEVTRGLFPPHLHLGWYDGSGGRSDVDSGAMNPYPLLEWIKSNGGSVTGGSNTRYCEALEPRPPSTGETQWPDQNDPGVRPDLDTGSDDPRPSPIVEKYARKDTAQENSPAKKPNRPNKPSKKDPNEAPSKPQATDRPEAQKPRPPDRPAKDPQRPEIPPPEQERPKPSKPAPLKPDRPPPNENQPIPPCDSKSPKPASPSSQYDCASGATPGSPATQDETGESKPAPTDKPRQKTTEPAPRTRP